MLQAHPYVSNGPWGGQGGGQWSYEFVGQLNRILIDHGTRIRSIMFEDSSGISEIFGGTGGKIAEVLSAGPCHTSNKGPVIYYIFYFLKYHLFYNLYFNYKIFHITSQNY